jgi:hypothetical protein
MQDSLTSHTLVTTMPNKFFKIGDGVTPWSNLKPSYVLKSQLQAKGDILAGTGPNTGARLAAGAPGQTLSIDGSGNLVWVDKASTSNYVQSGYADATYETQAEATAAHNSLLSSAAMNSTYESIAASNATHALMETFTHAAATYADKAGADSTYRPKPIFGLKTSTSTVINSTAVSWPSELQFNVDPNSIYTFEAVIMYLATAACGLSVTMDCPLSAHVTFGVHGAIPGIGAGGQFAQSPLAAYTSYYAPNTMVFLGGAGATTPLFATIKGIVYTGTYNGQSRFGFTQTNAVNDTGAQILVPSFIRARKVS